MKRIISSMFIFLIFNISLFSEQKIFISTKLKGDNLRKSILNWIKNKSINIIRINIIKLYYAVVFYGMIKRLKA